MGLFRTLSSLTLRQIATVAGAAVGVSAAEKGVDSVVGFLTERFGDRSQKLARALRKANERSWQALELALAGESFWEQCKGLLAPGDQKAFARQLQSFLAAAPKLGLGDPQAVRRKCLEELRVARKAGLLEAGALDPSELARSAGAFARFSDPQALVDAEWQAVGEMSVELRRAGHATLARFLELRPDGGPPLLAVSARFFFRREVETDPELFQGLAFARLEELAEAQGEGFAALAEALDRHGQRLEEMLADLSGVVVETHTAVLGVQTEQHRQGRRMDEIYEAVLEMKRAPAGAPAAEKTALGGLPASRFEATRLCLRVGDGPSRNVCLLAQREVRLGKNRDNDVVLRVLPASAEHDALTGRISRTHAVVRLTPEGAFWVNTNCQNGTLVAGKPLAAAASCPLLPGTIVRPANVLSLKCGVYSGGAPADGEAYRRFEQALGVQPLAQPGGVQAVRMTRVDNLPGVEEYVVFPRTALLGSDPSCPLHLPHPSVSPVHAQVVWLGQSFWLEPLQAGRPTLAGGRPVPLDHLAPLAPGLVLQVGDVRVETVAFQQCHLDLTPGA